MHALLKSFVFREIVGAVGGVLVAMILYLALDLAHANTAESQPLSPEEIAVPVDPSILSLPIPTKVTPIYTPSSNTTTQTAVPPRTAPAVRQLSKSGSPLERLFLFTFILSSIIVTRSYLERMFSRILELA